MKALIQFSEEEVQTVLLDVNMDEQHIKELCENLRIKKEFACIKYSNSRFIELLKEEKFKKESQSAGAFCHPAGAVTCHIRCSLLCHGEKVSYLLALKYLRRI